MITLIELAQTYKTIYARMEINKPFVRIDITKLPNEVLNVFVRKAVFGHNSVFVTLY